MCRPSPFPSNLCLLSHSSGSSAPGTAAVPSGEGTVAADGPGQDQGGSAPPLEQSPPPPSSTDPSAPPLPSAKAQEGPRGAEVAEREEEGQGRVLPPHEEAKAERTACPSSGSTDETPAAAGTRSGEVGTDSRPEVDEEGREHAEASGGGGTRLSWTEGEDRVPHPEEGQPDPEGGVASLAVCWEVEFSDGVSWLTED